MTAETRYTVTDLGGIPGFEANHATALNDDGWVVGILRRTAPSSDTLDSDDTLDSAPLALDFDLFGFLWRESRMTSLGRFNPNDINGHGQIVGVRHRGLRGNNPKSAAALVQSSRLKLLMPPGDGSSVAQAVNGEGWVVGSVHFAHSVPADPSVSGRLPFVWQGAGLKPLPLPRGCHAGNALSVNGRGQIVGEAYKDSIADHYAALWEGTEATLLGEPPGFNRSTAVAINGHGTILVQAVQSNLAEVMAEAIRRAFSDESQDADVLDVLDAFNALRHRQCSFLLRDGNWEALDGQANALNDLDQVVGWSGPEPDPTPSALLWHQGASLDLNSVIPNAPGWHLTEANDINNKGQIVGRGELNEIERAFLLTPLTK